MGILQYFIYLSVLVMGGGIWYKAIRFARMPLHLRWELYKMPNGKKRGKYGGSYFEEIDWWTKPSNHSFFLELREMMKEILLIKTLYRHNRSLWIFSFPLHLGLYLLIGFGFLLIVGGILILSGLSVIQNSANILSKSVYYLTIAFAVSGSMLGIIGASGLFVRRAFDRELRLFSAWTDYFNLLLLLAISACLLAGWATSDGSLDLLRAYTVALISIGQAPVMPGILQITLGLVSFFFLYFPFTHMSHFIGKYFAFHKVRWDDRASAAGNKIEAGVKEALSKKLNWSGSHVKAGMTWKQATTDFNPKAEDDKR